MAEGLDRPEQATADEIIAAVERDTERHVNEATLPDDTATIDMADARELVASFRRVRDAHRGRYVGPSH